MRSFASDNNSGVHPAVFEAMQRANDQHALGYGNDAFTERATAKFKQLLGDDIAVYYVYGGTGANVVGLSTVTRSHEAVICSDGAHIYTDECNAPEKLIGCKLLPVPHTRGKITVEGIRKHLHGFGDPHHPQPRVISISQVTELGTVYSIAEIREIADLAHEYGLLLHMDGARISNAAAALNLDLRACTRDAGVDVMSFGGTKNGLMYGEAVIFFNPALARDAAFVRKQSMQLASKMRFVAAQFEALLTDDLWRKNAQHANRMAARLVEQLREIPEIKFTATVDANGIFAIIPPAITKPLQEQFPFYVWDESTNEVRWMTSFDTTESDVNAFVAAIKQALREQVPG
ncbi:MAG: low specificity L-threonine aldolase [Anaerolineae bacterium]|nr:low specificity L-threonine aldolase [Anaerolineae bacterium]